MTVLLVVVLQSTQQSGSSSLDSTANGGGNLFSSFSIFKSGNRPRRPLKDRHVDHLLILMNYFNRADPTDFGGWRSFHPKFSLPTQLIITDPDDGRYGNEGNTEPDFGGLDLYQSLQFQLNKSRHKNATHTVGRVIQPNNEKIAEAYWVKTHTDHGLRDYYEYSESLEDTPQKCRRPAWKQRYYPSCNAFHEKDLGRDYDQTRAGNVFGNDQFYDSFLINHGYYRDVWVMHQPSLDDKSILKTVRWKHEYHRLTYAETLMDALVMERLTPSPRIVDIFGHCGSAVWVEALPFDVEETIIHGNGYMKSDKMENQELLKPLNDLTPRARFEMALAMAESIADLHGYAGGVIVHDDIQPCQWLKSKDGVLKLGDFNRAEIMDYNEKKKEYCPYNNGRGYGNYRAPEEFAAHDLDEKIDIYSFGNNIYALLTGLWVFYDNTNDDEVQKLVVDGKRAQLDPRWKQRSFIENNLVELMEQCWEHDPKKRPDIFTVIQQLRDIDKEFKRRIAE
jgi:hypothetical protein